MKYTVSLTIGENNSYLTTYEENPEDIFDKVKTLLLMMSTTSETFNCSISSCLEYQKNKEKHYKE